ncbi:ACT domain-containing protein [Alteromonas pelagimontana]|uniref:ACT domain-containing protein n=1 Tax=Alteromonas pelagimontana TaxID=1858656 RepID=A0A6M4MEG2_9ALTE|nr:ACT domain-containing protein [Alteromonas pelagimontana]QJR81407.1 ACT domain-containing protein [Alteromonas pelagimontana]
MQGETELITLLNQLNPKLDPKHYVFVSVEDSAFSAFGVPEVRGWFRESEGITLICEQHFAESNNWQYAGVFQCITCHVHSSLNAVGMTAAISAALARREISANVVAAYFHDHIFVPMEKAEQAVKAMQSVSAGQP